MPEEVRVVTFLPDEDQMRCCHEVGHELATLSWTGKRIRTHARPPGVIARVVLVPELLLFDDELELTQPWIDHAPRLEKARGPRQAGGLSLYSAAPWRLGWRCDPTLGGVDLDGYPEGEEGCRPSFTAMDFLVSPR